MFRLRFFRILLPVLLVLLVILVWKSWEPRSGPPRVPVDVPAREFPDAKGIKFKEFQGSDSSLSGQVDLFQPGEDESLHLEGIRELEIGRADGGPLIVSAVRGDREGNGTERVWRFDGEVVFREVEKGLELRLPTLVIDEEAGEARSEGQVFFSAPDVSGRASSLIYGLRGQPGQLTAPEFDDSRGGSMRAERARLLDGIRDVELVGGVEVVESDRRLDSERLRLVRGPDDRLERAEADGDVVAHGPLGEGPPATLEGQALEVRWDEGGEVSHLRLTGEALVARADESISAREMEAAREGTGLATAPWNVVAEGSVFVQGRFGGEPGLLRAESVEATLDASLVLLRADAKERVSFESGTTLVEAQRATFVASDPDGEIHLFGDGRRNARLAHQQTRVAARSIVTDLRGNRMLAEDRVEATLLPSAGSESGLRDNRLFVPDAAVHFVAQKLVSEDAGSRLVFTGLVRGWQGERNLSAERISVDQTRHVLTAKDNVATRIPRESGVPAVSEADYIQIAADNLDYDDASGQAVYTGSVRVRLAEGWLESDRVEVELSAETRRVHEIRAAGSVQLEVHRTSEGEMPRPFSGNADRLVYTPGESRLRLFGDRTPASVRRIGSGGGTTTGRVLTYHLDTGSLDVDSGGHGSRIRTGGN